MPRSRRPRIALVGAGGISGAHLAAYRAAGFDVAVIANRTLARAIARRDEFFPDAEATDDIAGTLARADIAVVDLTPHPEERFALIEAALAAGKHVLSQKPFVLDLDAGARLCDLADARGAAARRQPERPLGAAPRLDARGGDAPGSSARSRPSTSASTGTTAGRAAPRSRQSTTSSSSTSPSTGSTSSRASASARLGLRLPRPRRRPGGAPAAPRPRPRRLRGRRRPRSPSTAPPASAPRTAPTSAAAPAASRATGPSLGEQAVTLATAAGLARPDARRHLVRRGLRRHHGRAPPRRRDRPTSRSNAARGNLDAPRPRLRRHRLLPPRRPGRARQRPQPRRSPPRMTPERLGPALLDRLPPEVAAPGLRPRRAPPRHGAYRRRRLPPRPPGRIHRRPPRPPLRPLGRRRRQPPPARRSPPRLGRQHGLYTRLCRSGDSAEARVIGSIRRTVDSQHRPEPALAVLADPAIDVVTLTVTEKAYCHRPADGSARPHPPRHRPRPRPPRRAAQPPRPRPRRPRPPPPDRRRPGHPDQLRQYPRQRRHPRRRRRGASPPTAPPSPTGSPPTPPSPRRWSTASPPRPPTPTSTTVAERFGYRDTAVAVGEPLPAMGHRGPLRRAAARPGTSPAPPSPPTSTPYEHLKMRILNAAQTTLASLGVLAGHEHTFDAVADPLLVAFTERMLVTESLPTLAAVPGIDPTRLRRARASTGCATPRSATAATRSPPTARRRSSSACSTPPPSASAAASPLAYLPVAVAACLAYLLRAAAPLRRRLDRRRPRGRPHRRHRRTHRPRPPRPHHRHPRHRRDLPARPRRRPRLQRRRRRRARRLSLPRPDGPAPPPPRPLTAGHPPMKLGLLTAPFPDTPLAEVADWSAAAGFETLEIACWPRSLRPDPALCRHQPHRRRRPHRRRGARHPRRPFRPGPDHLRPRLLSQPAAPRRRPPRQRHRASPPGHYRAGRDGRRPRHHLPRRRRREDRRAELGGGPRPSGPTSSRTPAPAASSSPSRTAR